MVGEMFGQGNVLVGKCPVGEASAGEVSSRGIVWSGKCPSGKCLFAEVTVRDLSSGKCQLGNCPIRKLSYNPLKVILFTRDTRERITKMKKKLTSI